MRLSQASDQTLDSLSIADVEDQPVCLKLPRKWREWPKADTPLSDKLKVFISYSRADAAGTMTRSVRCHGGIGTGQRGQRSVRSIYRVVEPTRWLMAASDRARFDALHVDGEEDHPASVG
jgi:hypothetical protein